VLLLPSLGLLLMLVLTNTAPHEQAQSSPHLPDSCLPYPPH